MIFHDPSDADSAFKVIVRGQAPSGNYGAWWTNSAFTSYLQYIETVYQATVPKIMLWRVPVGNTLYLSNNNTSYYYQDNRPQYFLETGNIQNISNYAAQGVIGVLFGNGQAASTDYMDYANDGITNPPSINGNRLVASYSDDDGGFLRNLRSSRSK
jgi:hypothetical protein